MRDGSRREPLLAARGLRKSFGHIVALDGTDFDLYPEEILAVIGDNGAGKTTLIKVLSGAVIPDAGEILVEGQRAHFRSPLEARRHGIETVYQDLALASELNIAENLFLGREIRRRGILGRFFRILDKPRMLREAARHMSDLKIGIQSMNQTVGGLSGGQRQGVAVARSAAFATRVVIMDEPTAALGVKETRMVVEMIRRVKARGLPVVLISHNMPQVFELADRIHIQRLGRRVAVVRPDECSMSDAVAILTGAKEGNGLSRPTARSASRESSER
ncbi:MAG TPA: ATP-binding cassette domain-containing protein [Spirochaetia bacterium]|nr:ATP-binding cassette domain-containing protein [Spirochaetia bacterium]